MDQHTALQSTMARHAKVFEPGLGMMTDIASINLRQDASPKFYKHRTVSYAMHEAMEQELSHIKHEGTLEKFSTVKVNGQLL